MIKRIFAIALAALLCFAGLTAYGASSDDDDILGFYDWGFITDTTNQYFFYTDETVVVSNNELEDSPDYGYIYAGSDIYVPISVYVNGEDEERASDKLIKSDNVTLSWKAVTGAKYIDGVELADGKKLKLDGMEAGMYARISVTKDYSASSRALITMRLVLSVRDVTYQDTQVSLKFRITNRKTDIYNNSIYGAKSPTMFKVRDNYSGEATFDFGDNITYTTKVSKGATYYLSLSRAQDNDIKSMYPDAFLDFYNFTGDRDTFASTGALKIPVNRAALASKDGDESLYVYRIDGNTLTALGKGVVSYNPLTQTLKVNTKNLQYYVLSNQPLKKQVDESGDNILKSGYAAAAAAEVTEITPDSGGSSAAAPSQPSSAQEDSEGYVPEEDDVIYDDWSSNYNDNADTGYYINAANTSSDNPQTSAPALPPLAAAIPGAAALIAIFKNKAAKCGFVQQKSRLSALK